MFFSNKLMKQAVLSHFKRKISNTFFLMNIDRKDRSEKWYKTWSLLISPQVLSCRVELFFTPNVDIILVYC